MYTSVYRCVCATISLFYKYVAALSASTQPVISSQGKVQVLYCVRIRLTSRIKNTYIHIII